MVWFQSFTLWLRLSFLTKWLEQGDLAAAETSKLPKHKNLAREIHEKARKWKKSRANDERG